MTQNTYQQPQQTAPSPSTGNGLRGSANGTGVPALKLGKLHRAPNVWAGGRIVNTESYACTKVENKGTVHERRTPVLYPSGDQIWGLAIDVETDERDPENPADKGIRRIYVEGTMTPDYVSRRRAVIEAVEAKGDTEPRVGGVIYVGWSHEVQAKGISPAQSQICHYEPPANPGLHGSAPVQQQAAPVQQQYAPAPQQAPAPQYQPAPPQQYAPQAPVQQYAPAPPQAPAGPPAAPVQQYQPPAPYPQAPAAPVPGTQAPIQQAPTPAQSPEAAAALGQLDPAAMAALQQQLGAQEIPQGIQPTH